MKNQRSSLWVLYFAMMTVGMGQTVIFAVLPMLGRELALDQITLQLGSWLWQSKELAITSLSALTALTFSLVSPFWGRLSDRIGRKPVIVLGLFGYTLGVSLFNGVAYLGLQGALLGFSLYALLLLTRIIHASVMSAAFPAASAYVVDVSDQQQRTQGLSRLSAAMQLGVMCGPSLAYLVTVSYLTPFMVQALLTALAGCAVLYFLPTPTTKPVQSIKASTKKLQLWDSRYRFYIVVALATYSCLGMVQQTLGFYFQDILQIPAIEAAKQYSFAMIFSSAAMMFAQLVLVQRLPYSPHQFIFMGLPFLVLGFLCLSIAQHANYLYLGMALFGLAMGFCGPSFAAAASYSVEAHEQGALAGLIGSVAGMGFVIGPIVGGVLYALHSSYPYLAATSIASILLMSLLWHNKSAA